MKQKVKEVIQLILFLSILTAFFLLMGIAGGSDWDKLSIKQVIIGGSLCIGYIVVAMGLYVLSEKVR